MRALSQRIVAISFQLNACVFAFLGQSEFFLHPFHWIFELLWSDFIWKYDYPDKSDVQSNKNCSQKDIMS